MDRTLRRRHHVGIYRASSADFATKFPPFESLNADLVDLPHPLTSFVGRRSELSRLRKVVRESRLTTLLGAGGVGKSRLAIQVARILADEWPDGVRWVDLASVEDGRDVPAAVVSTLRLRGIGPGITKVTSWLSGKKILLVLDNCEHVIAGCTDLCRSILESSPGVKVIATSREPLRVPGEARWPVLPMTKTDATNLFEDRGRLVVPGFAVTPANRDIVIEICRKLDQLPLAIELAAPRLSLMTEREIAAQLGEKLSVLVTGPTGSGRHQSMTATIDWSYRLLSSSEAALFRRLAVFHGGFTLEGARAICAGRTVDEVLESLGGLVEKSMVVAERLDGDDTRYRLLELQAAYAFDKLRETGELAALQKRHYEFFARSMAAIASDPLGPPEVITLTATAARNSRKHRELANLWAALRWARINSEDLGLDLAWMFNSGGAIFDADRLLPWIQELLEHFPPDRPIPSSFRPGEDSLFRANAVAFGHLCLAGDFVGALDHAQRNVELTNTDDSTVWKGRRAVALRHLARALESLHRLDEARAALEEANVLAREGGAGQLIIDIARDYGHLALVAGRVDEARKIYTEIFETTRANSPGAMAWGLVKLASVGLVSGDLDMVDRNLKQALAIAKAVSGPYMIQDCLDGLCRLATLRGDHVRALRLAALHERGNQELSSQDEPFSRDLLQRSIKLSRDKLGSKKSDEAWGQGAAMDQGRAIDYALKEGDLEVADKRGALSRRETAVAKLVAQGMTNREIADKLFLSERTVEGHVDRIRNKLTLRSRTEVATWVHHQGLLNP